MSETKLTGLSPGTLLVDEYQRRNNLDKWGWVFYRCTYGDDEKWDSFKRTMTQGMQDSVTMFDTPAVNDSLLKSLAMTFMEDPAIFENASKDQLRAHFQPWARNAYYAENPRVTRDLDPDIDAPPRYGYFIQVDEDVLRSVTDAGRPGQGEMQPAYVNFVNGWWKSYSEQYAISQDPSLKSIADREVEENHEPIDGCVEFNVGWMMLDQIDISVEFYHDIGWGEESWFVRYHRPPGICSW